MIYVVDSNTTLKLALQLAQPGDEVKLKAAETPYDVYVRNTLNVEGVKFTSFDADDPATISSLRIGGAKDLEFDGFLFNNGDVVREDHIRIIKVFHSENITIKNSVLTSTAEKAITQENKALSEEHGDGLGEISNVDGFYFENNVASNFRFGFLLRESVNIGITDNDMHSFQADPIRMAGVANVLIEGNHIHDMLGTDYSLNHPDLIQMWSTKANRVSENITITGNILDTGDGAGSQSIFFRNEQADGYYKGDEGRYYKNITITDNVIYNSHVHGISIGQTIGVTIENNTLIRNPEALMVGREDNAAGSPSISVHKLSQNVTVTDNVAGSIKKPADAVVSGNVSINYVDPAAENYVDKMFINAEHGGSVSAVGLQALPGGVLAESGAGSSLTQFDPTPETLTAAYVTDKVNGSETVFRFDASLTADADGFVGADGATYLWTFSDGATAEGMIVEHAFTEYALETVTLTVTDGDGAVSEAHSMVRVANPVLLDIHFDAGAVANATAYASRFTFDAEQVLEGGFHVSEGEIFKVDRENGHIFGLEQFTLSFDIKLDEQSDPGGTIFAIPRSLGLRLDDGDLTFNVKNSEGDAFTTGSSGLAYGDNEWHRISVSFDGVGGQAHIYFDGQEVAQMDVDGNTKPRQSWDMSFGHPWSTSVSALVDNILMTTEPLSAAAAAQDFAAFVEGRAAADMQSPKFNLYEGEYFSDWASVLPDETDLADDYNLMTRIETIEGSSDTAKGDEDANLIVGDGDANVAKASAGDDEIRGFDGDDHLNGQDGDDRIDGGAGDDILVGRDGNDVLVGGDGANKLYGGAGDDIYVVTSVDDTIHEGRNGGHDKVIANVAIKLSSNVEDLEFVGAENRRGKGNGLDNEMIGNAGGNKLYGGGGDDRLFGNDGNDVLKGQAGVNLLVGGDGDDKLSLRGGENVVVFEAGDDFDRIYRFEDGVDRIDLSSFGFAGMEDLAGLISQSSRGVDIDFGDGDQLRLIGAELASIDAADFIF